MEIDLQLLNGLDLTGAADLELRMSNRRMPRRPDRLALASRAEDIGKLLRNRYAKGQFGQPADLVFADKNRSGRRPMSEMTLQDKVLYRALVDHLAKSLPSNVVTRQGNREFKAAPLQISNAQYVSVTDVSSYYEYIDHERLADELEAQTGDAPVITVLMELLFRVMGRRIGLPQIHKSSDILGDTYIDPVRRRMRRAGYQVTTYSDDFRIVSSSLADARDALETCAREVRTLGLTLNESKTFTYSIVSYVFALQAFADAERELFRKSDGNDDLFTLLLETDYPDESDESTDSDSQTLGLSAADAVSEQDALDATVDDTAIKIGPARAAAAERALELWVAELSHPGMTSRRKSAITESLVARALPILGRTGNDSAVEHLSALLRKDPALAPQVSDYVVELAKTGQRARMKLRKALDQLVDEPSFSLWQKMWIAHAAGSIRATQTPHRYYQWLNECVIGAEPPLAATAAAALGRLKRGDVDVMRQALDRVSPAWRPLVYWGLARQDLAAAADSANDRFEQILVEELTP
ncbi:RNA-directed DNA polymerase [Microbacterium lacus]|uniref:RNA-directed DNA polymerase n=1 Tax=Microbacterium lacus TaxID=415217 RepID=UPI00385157DB